MYIKLFCKHLKTQAWRLYNWFKLQTFGNENVAKILQPAKEELEKVIQNKKIPELFQVFEESAFQKQAALHTPLESH